jgi:hypothetical protein
MDSTKEDLDIDLKELMDKLTVDGGYESAATSSLDVSTNDLCYDSSPYTYSVSDTITLSGIPNGGSTVLNPGGFTGSYGQVYTVGASVTGSNTSPWATGAGSGGFIFPGNAGKSKITLNGDDADIEINGKSLAKTLEALEERLNILVPNPAMEKEWDQLKRLGDKYRKLEKKLKEQSNMWDKLKSMPPPEIY